MAKYHFLTGDDLDALPLDERIARCVEIKAAFVAADEREGGRRALLNYGHTLAHALEIATAPLRSPTARRSASGSSTPPSWPPHSGASTPARVADHRAVVGGTYGLPTTIPAGIDDDQLLDADGRATRRPATA